jgi:DNA-binding NarL/FixJ family response regulator
MPFFASQLNEISRVDKVHIALTTRELEILKMIGDGFSNPEIAEKLFISYRTVANHRANLKKKTLAKNTAELIRFGLKNKLIAP